MRRFRAKVVILATGSQPVSLESAFPETVDSSLIHRDITTFRKKLTGQRIAVIGGGDAAADSALSLADRGANPFLLVRGEKLKCNDRLINQLKKHHINIFFETTLVKTVHLSNENLRLELESGGNISCNGILACVGREPLSPDLSRVPEGQPGLILAGDITGTPCAMQHWPWQMVPVPRLKRWNC